MFYGLEGGVCVWGGEEFKGMTPEQRREFHVPCTSCLSDPSQSGLDTHGPSLCDDRVISCVHQLLPAQDQKTRVWVLRQKGQDSVSR